MLTGNSVNQMDVIFSIFKYQISNIKYLMKEKQYKKGFIPWRPRRGDALQCLQQ